MGCKQWHLDTHTYARAMGLLVCMIRPGLGVFRFLFFSFRFKVGSLPGGAWRFYGPGI